jgi:uncharacterized radical SAM superfamily Fe-S cluster-containing enzyme
MNDLVAATVKELANAGWHTVQTVNGLVPENASLQPGWAPGPLIKSRERTKPPLGWPRETDSLCPRCVVETRNSIINGERDLADLVQGHNGEIKATILEENGRVIVRKTCPEHGTFEDLLSIDPEFSRIIEARYPGRDFRTLGDERIHRHGTSTIRYGRGAVLTIDLTNRCNMMCNPCFMDANQVGYVHELTLDEIKQILDDSISFKPRRQMSVQYSGGEPTMSPHFLEACRYAKDLGYYSVQAATNGLRFALGMLRHFDQRKAPPGFTLTEFLRILNKKTNGALMAGRKPPPQDWKMLWVGGMWFQDLWTYDFRRTEMCVIPYATQEGEISFCAYNTGVGWRQIVENMHMVANTKDWFQRRGRHKIYAGDRPMDLPSRSLPVVSAPEPVGAGAHACGCGGH